MGLVIKLNNIISPNTFTVSYKTGPNPYPLDSGFTSYSGTYSAGTTLVVVSGITINFNSTYWFKITDTVTNRYIIENIETNDPIAYTTCCEVPTGISAVCVIPTTPTPTPTATPTPTPTIACEVPTDITAYCSDSVTPTPTPTATPTSTPTPTPTATPTGISLQINVRDVASLPDTLTMFYSVNGGSNVNIPGGTGVVFPVSCTNIHTITGLSVNDEIVFGTNISCIMTGAQGLTCPSSIGSSTTYTYTMDVISVQSVGITIDSDIIP